MNPNKGRVLISLALIVSGIVGVGIALTQSPRGIALLQSPPTKIDVLAAKPAQKEVPQQSRAQEITTQLGQSNAAQLLKQLSNEAGAKVKNSESAIEGFIRQKANQQRDYLKQIVVDALHESVTGEVTQRSTSLANEFKGVNLTTEQSTEIQKARREMQTEMVKQFQNNPQLVTQLQSDLQQGRLNSTLSQPIKDYSNVVASILTPQQQQKWQKNFDLAKLLNR